jgi:signal transduction histidine kinase
VVDDDHLVRIMVQLGLERNGFDVWLASNGREAIELYRAHQEEIAVVLLDARMPDRDGPRTLDALRELDPEIRACFMSGDAGAYEPDDMVQRGVAYVIAKPFLLDDLASIIWALANGESADLLPSGRVRRGGAWKELWQRTQELEEAARHKDYFLGMLAHELRSPIGTIRNVVEVLTQIGPPDPKSQWARDVIGRQTDHMAHLIEDLLDASRIAQRKVSIRKETVDLNQIVGQAVETCRHLLTARGQQVTISLPSRPVLLLADPTRLVQVLTNLLNNAAKFTEDGGQIWLTAAEEKGEVVVRVRDNGIGIDGEMLPRIFELFTQVPAASERSDGGLGIGLAMVEQLVQLHGGTVQAFSDGPGRGSEFVIRMPVLSATRVGRNDAQDADHLPAESPPRRIDVAEENRDKVEAVGASSR